MPPLVHMLQRRTWRFLGVALGLLLAATAACGPGEPEHLGAPSHIQRSLNPAWRVAPSVEQQIFSRRRSYGRRCSRRRPAAETLPSDPGATPTYQAVQELRFTVHEYLKGSGPTSLLVVVRGADGYPSEAAARADAAIAVQLRVTTWTRGRRCSSSRRRRRRTPRPAPAADQGSLRGYRSGRLAVHALEQQRVAVGLQRGHAEPGLAAGAGPAGRGQAPTAFITDGPNRRRPRSPWPTCGPGSRRWRRNWRRGPASMYTQPASTAESSVSGITVPTRGRHCRKPRRWPPGQRRGRR